MRSNLSLQEVDITWINSNLGDLELDIVSKNINLDWEVVVDTGSYWARLEAKVLTKKLILDYSFEDGNLYDEESGKFLPNGEGEFELTINFPEVEVELDKIRQYGSFSIVKVDMELSLSAENIAQIKRGESVEIEARKVKVLITDC